MVKFLFGGTAYRGINAAGVRLLDTRVEKGFTRSGNYAVNAINENGCVIQQEIYNWMHRLMDDLPQITGKFRLLPAGVSAEATIGCWSGCGKDQSR